MVERQLDVLFVQASSSATIYQGLASKYSSKETPTWALLLAQSCRAVGFGVGLLDADVLGLSHEAAVEHIKDVNPRLVVFVVMGSEPNQSSVRMSGSTALCDKLKETYPEFKTCFVGNHVSALPLETLEKHPSIDFVLLNEGVLALHNLLLTDLEDVDNVKGIGWRNGTEPVLNPPQAIVKQEDMDELLPGYAWNLIPSFDIYRSHFWLGHYDENKTKGYGAVYTSLGCPYRCEFCCISLISRINNDPNTSSVDNSVFRYWSPDHTMKQIDALVERGVTNIRLSDEMFFLKESHYRPLLTKIRDKYNDRLNMWCYARADTVKPKMLELFRSAGIRFICIGIESGSAEIRKIASKGSYTDTNIHEVVDQIHAADIDIISNVIFGLKGDTYKTMNQTLDLALSLNTLMFNAYPAMALCGTPLYIEAKKKGIPLPETYSGYGFLSYDCLPLPTDTLSAADVLRFRDEAFYKYWDREEFLCMVHNRCGEKAATNVTDMLKIRLKRKLLGDPEPT